MAKFLIINSPNKKNIGIIRDYSETFESPDVFKLTDEQVNEWNTISPMERTFRLNEYKETNDKKKIFQIVEAATKPVEKESVEFVSETKEMPEVEFEPLPPFEEIERQNEPVNETANDLDSKFVEAISQEEYKKIKEEYSPIVDEKISNAVKEITKAKRAYNKKVK